MVPISPGGGASLRFLASVLEARAVVEIGTGTQPTAPERRIVRVNGATAAATSPAVSSPASTGSTFSGATTRMKPTPQLKVRRSS